MASKSKSAPVNPFVGGKLSGKSNTATSCSDIIHILLFTENRQCATQGSPPVLLAFRGGTTPVLCGCGRAPTTTSSGSPGPPCIGLFSPYSTFSPVGRLDHNESARAISATRV